MNVTIVNAANGRRTDYTPSYLRTEARHALKGELQSDGKVRALRVEISEMASAAAVRLAVDYLTWAGEPRTCYVAI